MVEAQQVLLAVGMAALRSVVDSLPDFSELGDVDTMACDAARLPHGATSATVHRFVRYIARDSDAPGRVPGVQFEGHTDGTWFTVIPCAKQPGLEVRTASGWCSVEEQSRHGIDVAVLSGDFLESLSNGKYKASSHRVALPASAGVAARSSAPLLMRASTSYREQCKRADRRRKGSAPPPVANR
uniref:Isopenicillin N synthase-like Fe(2+) 2OG dioxygenase domain-containing protein n=1 Tax=Prymnesium polylepis TaxID=72548 RepID=A0A7S4J017_9EUKA|mmetsp:Transcript_37285/g.93140  ORF Transcript_37285/g.93140 Transcript_37285/m.93140 type:complete len:184 (+) Transcript_37285:1-552(+)